MTKFKFGDKVRVKDFDQFEWEEAVYVRRNTHSRWPHAVLEGRSGALWYYEQCQLIEAAPRVVTPKFKVGDKVVRLDNAITSNIKRVKIAYELDNASSNWYDDDLELAPKEIKVGDKVKLNNFDYSEHNCAEVGALYTDKNTIAWAVLLTEDGCSYNKLVQDLELIDA